jgi:hypothetical protein
LEVESVLRDVCDKVLGDSTASRETRKQRAIGLQMIGNIYQKVKADGAPDIELDKNKKYAKHVPV